MKPKNLIPAFSLLGITILSVPVAHAADAATTSWYGGISVGQSNARDFSASDLNSTLAQSGLTASGTSVDDTDTGWKLFAGYQFNPYFAVEGGYLNLGRFDAHTTVTAVHGSPITPTSVDARVKVKDGLFIDAVGILPITEQLSAFGKLGVYSLKTEISASAGGASASDNARNSDLTYGLGVSYSFNKELALRAEWERFRKVGDSDKTGQSDVDLLSLGLTYRFY